MTTPFLLDVARYILDKPTDEAGNLTVVLPTRRAAVFLRHHLASLITRTVWAPDIVSIEDFVFRLSGLQAADPVELLFELYGVHLGMEGADAKPADEFFPVGEVMLADFDEVDQHLVDPAELFGYLHQARAIDLWNPDGSDLTEFQRNYLKFYESLGRYYEALHQRMIGKGQVWQGLAGRIVSQRLAAGESLPVPGQVLLAGFNAFTPAEESIVAKLYSRYGAVVFWDTDPWYMDNQVQEAGHFLRRYRQTGTPAPVMPSDDCFGSGARSITLIGAPLHVAQVKEAGRLLATAPFTREPGWQSRTAVVLADESLLLPLLNSIPPSAGKFNVTMGIPLRMTPAGSLLELWFDMVANQRPNSTPGEPVYYLSDLQRITNHPLMAGGFSAMGSEVNKRIASNHLFVSVTELWQLLDRVPEPRSADLALPRNTVDLLLYVVGHIIAEAESQQQNSLSLISAASLVEVLVRVRHYLDVFQAGLSLAVMRRLVGRLTASVRIPFAGEPLAGIQVMGMLETRALDFDNVVLVGANDDILPGSGHTPSFIPGDIRTETFGMTGFREKAAVMAYHFYRLMQRTRSAYLIYNNIPGNLGKGEPSRFLLQIRHEFPAQFPNIILEERVVAGLPAASAANDVSIVKTPDVMQKLREAASRGFSPTSVSLLVECPLRFYMGVVEGINEPRPASIAIGSDYFGNAVHDVAEQIYKPLLNTVLSPESLTVGREVIREMLTAWFAKNMPDLDLYSGNNLLVYNVAVDYLDNFLRKERSLVTEEKVIPLLLETPLKRTISFEAGGLTEQVLFKGRADRIDLRGGDQVMIDYKTGIVDPRSVAVVDFESLVTHPKQAKALQLMTYAWLSAGVESLNPPFRCAIWPMRAPSKALIYLNFPGADGGRNRHAAADMLVTDEKLALFEQALTTLLTDLFDRDLPFIQTDDVANCRFCPFVEMCNRVTPGR